MAEPPDSEPSTAVRRARCAALLRPLSAYVNAYRESLRQPFALLFGQLLTFFAISLYVKLVEMRLAPEFADAWLTNGRALTNLLQFVLFSGQEICLSAALLIAAVVWQRSDPDAARLSRVAIGALAFVILPVLSATKVLGLAHFAFFLTPLGPEELRAIVWAPMIVSSSNVLQLSEVVVGLALIVTAYYVAPCSVVLPQVCSWQRRRAWPIAAMLVAGVLAVSVPKPMITDALLVPHPLVWMLLGNRPQPAWADAAGDVTVDTLAGHPGFTGRPRFAVKQRPTNVVLLVLESTRAESVALYNTAARAGRGLLRWQDEMVVFDHVYAPVPTSAHAIFSILYGVYPYLGPFWSSADKAVVADSLGQLFGRSGYATHFYVTADLDYDNVRSYAASGFDRVLDSNDWPGQEAYALLPWGRDDRLLLEESKRFIASQGKRPFFLFAMTSNPHHPYAADQLFPDAPAGDTRAAYEQLVDYNLRLVGELYAWMKARGVAERTLFIVLGDHGEAFGEHAGNFGHAAFIYDENVHVPCFILHPRRLGLPGHIDQLGSQVDLRPTILDILGMRDSSPRDGMSLLREDPERLIANFTENGVTRFGLRDARFTYIYTPHVAVEQVFDRHKDPHEIVNIAEREPSITSRYRARLRRWEFQHQLSLAKVLR